MRGVSRSPGTGPRVAQADALLKQARSSIPPLRIAPEAQLNRLDVLMGAQPGTYASELAKPGIIPAIRRSMAATSPSTSCDVDPTSSRPSDSLPLQTNVSERSGAIRSAVTTVLRGNVAELHKPRVMVVGHRWDTACSHLRRFLTRPGSDWAVTSLCSCTDPPEKIGASRIAS
jgi:hypothetical protein